MTHKINYFGDFSVIDKEFCRSWIVGRPELSDPNFLHADFVLTKKGINYWVKIEHETIGHYASIPNEAISEWAFKIFGELG